MNTLWDALLELDDLTASTNSIMTLLSSLLTYPQVRQCRYRARGAPRWWGGRPVPWVAQKGSVFGNERADLVVAAVLRAPAGPSRVIETRGLPVRVVFSQHPAVPHGVGASRLALPAAHHLLGAASGAGDSLHPPVQSRPGERSEGAAGFTPSAEMPLWHSSGSHQGPRLLGI